MSAIKAIKYAQGKCWVKSTSHVRSRTHVVTLGGLWKNQSIKGPTSKEKDK